MYLNLDTFAGRLMAALNHRGISQAELAQTLGIHRQAITAIKGGQAPGRKHLPAMAKALDVSLDWLVTGSEAHAPLWIRQPPRGPSALEHESFRLEQVLLALKEANGDAEARARLLKENETLKATVAALRTQMQEIEQGAGAGAGAGELDEDQQAEGVAEAAMGLPGGDTPVIDPKSRVIDRRVLSLRRRNLALKEALKEAQAAAKSWEEQCTKVTEQLRAEREYHRTQLESLTAEIPHAAALARRVGRGQPWVPPLDT